ncbi:MAG TPA: DUF2480 family protein [Chitinophagales bacterium]|jgi:hypothetical protein|nr:DUF2480 family protein [Chitinophagales bacterium]
MSEPLINKVAQSGIITLDLEVFFPTEEILPLDIKDFLFRGLLLKELEFRANLKNVDWTAFQDKSVAVFCSSDAILPQWAYMLIVVYLQQVTKEIYFGTIAEVEQKLLLQNIQNMNVAQYQEERLIIKGCGTKALGGEAYLEITKKLKPVVKSLMFGEPCSTVPVYKKK